MKFMGHRRNQFLQNMYKMYHQKLKLIDCMHFLSSMILAMDILLVKYVPNRLPQDIFWWNQSHQTLLLVAL